MSLIRYFFRSFGLQYRIPLSSYTARQWTEDFGQGAANLRKSQRTRAWLFLMAYTMPSARNVGNLRDQTPWCKSTSRESGPTFPPCSRTQRRSSPPSVKQTTSSETCCSRLAPKVPETCLLMSLTTSCNPELP